MKYLSLLVLFLAGTASAQTTVFINEIHYDNAGTDVGEAIEIAGPAGTDLSGWSVVLYNGSSSVRAPYNTQILSGTVADDGSGFGFVTLSYPSNGIQNGAPDGIALVDPSDNVVEFLSYEGSFEAASGPAMGMTSTDIGVAESSSTAAGSSLQRTGTGSVAGDFTFAAPAANTFGAVNTGQVLLGQAVDPFINEFHYDNAGGDVGEGVEIAGPAGTELAGWELVLYNGSSSVRGPYNTIALSGTLADQTSGYGFVEIAFPSNGIQNGAPDGLALVSPGGDVIQFLSYEGSFEALSGPAIGMTSTDIGVSESSSTPVGDSLQLTGTGRAADDFTWAAPQPNTFGAVNAGQSFGAAPPPPPPPPPMVSICEIQGTGTSSPIVGQEIMTVGVVTGDFQDGAGTHGDLNGFFIEDPGCDSNADSSNGVFVFDGFAPAVDVMPGQQVRVTGDVAEFFGETQVNAGGGSVEVIGSGSVTPTPISLPTATTVVNGRGELIADLERYEGMLVTVPQTLTVTELFNLDRFGEVLLTEGARPEQFTQSNVPDATGFEAHLELLARRGLLLDDGLTVQNPDPIRYPAPGLTTANAVRMGDTATGVTGNIRYSRGSGGSGDEAYRLEPTVEPAFAQVNFRPSEPADVGGRIQVASFNLLNFFNDTRDTGECFADGQPVSCRGASNAFELERQTQKLVTALSTLDADVIGVNELENDYVDEDLSSIAELVDRLNEAGSASCGSNYDYVHPPGDVNVGDDAIAVGFIYCASTVSLAEGTVIAMLDDSQAGTVGFEAPLFDGNATNRVPLAATFEENLSGERFTAVVNHFKSKGSSGLSGDPDCSLNPAVNPDCDQGDGAGYWNDRRTRAAQAVADWLATDPTGAGDPDAVIVGDLNAYLMEDPIGALEAAGYGNLIGYGDYSFVFDGQTGTLDYGFVSSSLSMAVTGVDEWHINADEADALDYNTDFGRNPSIFDGAVPYRASDHDPLLFGVDLPDTIPPVLSCNAPEVVATRDHGVSFTASAVDALDDSPSVAIVSAGCERKSPSGSGRPSQCSSSIDGDSITWHQLGGAKNVLSWTAQASDASGNSSEIVCSVEVVPTARTKR